MSLPDIPWEFEIHPISRHLDMGSFDCGATALNEYLQKYARQNHDRNIGKTFVAFAKRADRKVLGYYTAVASEIDVHSIPQPHSKHLPRYPVPVVRIGRLAVDKHHQGQMIGEGLLVDAIGRAKRLSIDVGIYGVVVDAKDDNAVRFYHKYGFVPLSNNAKTLFLPIETIKALFFKKGK